jgi:hypothetical protein
MTGALPLPVLEQKVGRGEQRSAVEEALPVPKRRHSGTFLRSHAAASFRTEGR